MGLFKKAHANEGDKRLETLLETAMTSDPSSDRFAAAVAALRDEGRPGCEYVLSVARKGVPLKKLDGLWAAVAAMGDPVVPGVADLMKTGHDSAQVRAAKALCALAQTSPASRESCVASLREIVESGDEQYNEYLHQTAAACLAQLSAEA